jgi:hypothetical protein
MMFSVMWHRHFNLLFLYPVTTGAYELYQWMYLHVLNTNMLGEKRAKKNNERELKKQQGMKNAFTLYSKIQSQHCQQ